MLHDFSTSFELNYIVTLILNGRPLLTRTAINKQRQAILPDTDASKVSWYIHDHDRLAQANCVRSDLSVKHRAACNGQNRLSK
jgi:hypothetical protein